MSDRTTVPDDLPEGTVGRDDGLPFGIIPHWLLGAVKPSAIVVYLALTTWADNRSGLAFPGIAALAEAANLSLPTTRSALKELEEVGAVRVEERFRADGSQTTNNYWLRARNPAVAEENRQGRVQETDTPRGATKEQGQGYKKPAVHELDPDELDPLELDSVAPTGLERLKGTDAYASTKRLADWIANNGSRSPTITQAWITEIDRMHRIDGLSWDQINGAIEWSQRHEFWASVILSPKKLRAKYDQMRLQAAREQQAKKPKMQDAYERFLASEEGIL